MTSVLRHYDIVKQQPRSQ